MPLIRQDLEPRFPAVFAPTTWGPWVEVLDFTLSEELPPKEQVNSAHVIPFIGDDCITISTVDLGPLVPGGKREPEEELLDTARRELMEETGARLLMWSCLGWWSLKSSRDEPNRPWLPHPDFVCLILLGEVEIVGDPTQPEDGEIIERVDVLPVPDVAARFERVDRPELADLYRLAAHVRAERTAPQTS